MDPIGLVKHLPLLNTVIAAVLFVYPSLKPHRNYRIRLFAFSLLPVLALQIGTYLFAVTGQTKHGSILIVLGILLVPATFTPLSRALARNDESHRSKPWITYYGLQLALLGVVFVQVLTGAVIEWVTGILDQPVIIINKSYKFLFLNTLLACGLTLYGFEATLKGALRSQIETLRLIFIAFVGFTVYFAYISSQVLFTSYISQTELLSGAAIILIGMMLLSYSILRYPLWEVEVQITRRAVFGTLSITALVMYLTISGSVLELLRSVRPERYSVFLPVTAFALAAIFLLLYLSPQLRSSGELFFSNYIFRNRYDYRDLWMKFSEKCSGAMDLRETLRRVGEFISEAMFQRQVTIWLRAPNSDDFVLEYARDAVGNLVTRRPKIQWQNSAGRPAETPSQSRVWHQDEPPFADNSDVLRELSIERLIPIEQGNEVIAILGIGSDRSSKKHSIEDDRLLTNISKQIGHLIANQRLSEALLLAREWESFNRFSSFVIHDLKNLATLQSMTLENAKSLRSDPRFVGDAFETFGQSTDKMINLIASLSVQRGQFSLKKTPVNVLEVLSGTFGDLKIDQRTDLTLKTIFPPPDRPPMIAGDPELLRKVFTNLLLNAIQSLPQGHGQVEVTVRNPGNGVIQAGIRDNGCGISPEQLKNLFRPFQTTKKNGMGIGLCHTRSIVEIHGGHIHIDSRINEGTVVELEFPRL